MLFLLRLPHAIEQPMSLYHVNELENITADRSSWGVFNARPVVSYRQIADSPVTPAVVFVHQRTHLWTRDPSCRRLSPSSSSSSSSTTCKHV